MPVTRTAPQPEIGQRALHECWRSTIRSRWPTTLRTSSSIRQGTLWAGMGSGRMHLRSSAIRVSSRTSTSFAVSKHDSLRCVRRDYARQDGGAGRVPISFRSVRRLPAAAAHRPRAAAGTVQRRPGGVSASTASPLADHDAPHEGRRAGAEVLCDRERRHARVASQRACPVGRESKPDRCDAPRAHAEPGSACEARRLRSFRAFAPGANGPTDRDGSAARAVPHGGARHADGERLSDAMSDACGHRGARRERGYRRALS